MEEDIKKMLRRELGLEDFCSKYDLSPKKVETSIISLVGKMIGAKEAARLRSLRKIRENYGPAYVDDLLRFPKSISYDHLCRKYRGLPVNKHLSLVLGYHRPIPVAFLRFPELLEKFPNPKPKYPNARWDFVTDKGYVSIRQVESVNLIRKIIANTDADYVVLIKDSKVHDIIEK